MFVFVLLYTINLYEFQNILDVHSLASLFLSVEFLVLIMHEIQIIFNKSKFFL